MTEKNRLGLITHVGKYNTLAELATATTGLTFSQLLRGDTTEPQKTLKKIRKSRPRTKVLVAPVIIPSRILKVVSLHIHGNKVLTLLDSRAGPNLISASSASNMGLDINGTSRKITFADGTSKECLGLELAVLTIFGHLMISLDYLVVKSLSFATIVGCASVQ